MRRYLLTILFWLGLAATAHAQLIQPGQKVNLQTSNATATISVANETTLVVQVQGTWTGTLTFEASLDGSTYQAANCTAINSTTAVTTTTANGVFSCSIIGLNFLQTRFSAFGSGAATVSYNTAYVAGGAGSGGSGGSGGNVTIVQGGNTASVNGSSQLLVNCGNCTGTGVSVNEDDVAAGGAAGTPAYAVRSDVLALTTSNNGDWTWLKSDQNGAMWVNPYAFTPVATTYLTFRQSDGTNFLTPSVDYTHNTLLTPATTAGPAVICRSSTAAPAATTADDYAALLSCSRTGALNVNIVSGAGSGGTSSADGAAYVAGTTTGTPMMGARDDAAPGALAEDKVGIVRLSSRREMFSQIRDAAGNERGVNVTAGNALQVDGSATTQPVSGTVTANIGSAGTLALDATLTARLPAALGAGGGIKVDGSGTALPVSGTVTANAGTNLNTSALALDATLTTRLPAALGAGGGIKVDGSGTALPVSGTVAATIAAPTTVTQGQKTVAVTNTAVALATTTTIKSVTAKALAANAGTVYLGGSGVTTANGFALGPNDTVSLGISDLATVFINGTSGDGVSFVAVN